MSSRLDSYYSRNEYPTADAALVAARHAVPSLAGTG
jgi:hypothetical protein